ncbi:ABC transporter permease subunit [Clostridium tagluense]|uniref:ABC transporter permease n=1 Tax=Clostridium tagluense TaxID=360422 RepID=UPI001C6E1F9C|nr:ABC transporter permease subunit [Clostridium tagluense]MBW9156869.1 ABC transporter permease subunit [Clostridium tagluense]MCB2311470.1 ABC transporter permease subunit [Clostridium tagluense]MCB2316194.1 ABC transporter permease subunit [Clostridium tagluense]MCB2321002.1 ABC transporter permease subunit [Clostridium tagluense]MCB2326019.1 ABC transporter permease subunit [Clostridium tagluense]
MKLKKIDIRRKFGMMDIVIFISLGALLFLIISPSIGKQVTPSGIEISTNIANLPMYAFLSVRRMMIAYILSLIFTFVYGYIAANNKKAEKFMIPILDILQSIPVLSFLPAVVLGLMAIFPNGNLGIEISCIILIFTGQVWNMTFSFYNSTKIIPKDLREASEIFQLNKWSQFKKLELPFSAIGLVWNSMMSWSGGWFFLMACEMFRLKGKDFRLPGLGSYLQTASNAGDKKALFWGILTLILVIVLLDQLIWRPVIAWSDKFKVELTGSQDAPHSFILTMIRRSVIIETVTEKALAPLFAKVNQKIDSFVNKIEKNKRNKNSRKSTIGQIIKWSIRMVFMGFFIYSTYGAIKIVSDISIRDLAKIPPAVTYSFLRVAVAQIIALAWTVPLGVAIGMNKKIANILQPIIQVIASIPATAIFPIVLAFFINIFGGLSFASILLMLLGTQWYILFNVIAGAMSIPEDLKEAAKVYGLKGWKKWKILILPSIFPYLLTGMVTATGGCWNASIVSEYVSFGGQTVSTIGLGALISEATETGNFPLLIVSTIVMCIVVVCVNKVLWKKLYSLSEERFKIEI